VTAEIQQPRDAAFRLFCHGSQRELPVDDAVAVVRRGPPGARPEGVHLTEARTLPVACPYFVLERIGLVPASSRELNVSDEIWLHAIAGHARVGPTNLSIGEAVSFAGDRVSIEAGAGGLSGLGAYPATEPGGARLHARDGQTAPYFVPRPAVHSMEVQS
jgi:mannose-6-phosphate isomerase